MADMSFDYYEIRPCVDFGDHVESYLAGDDGNGNPTIDASADEAVKALTRNPNAKRLFWTLYGRFFDKDSDGYLAIAIGDFSTAHAALEVMNAILAPMASVRDVIQEECCTSTGGLWGFDGSPCVKRIIKAGASLEDVINQSSTRERI